MLDVIEPGIAGSAAPVDGTDRSGDPVATTHVPGDPATGRAVEGRVEGRARRLFENLTLSGAAAGGSPKEIVSVLIVPKEASEAGAMNGAYGKSRSEADPTRAAGLVKEPVARRARIALQARARIA